MVGRPHSYTMGAPYHYTQRHQSHWAWKNSTSLALDPTENGQVAILPTGDMEAQVTPEMHEMMHMWGQWWWNITRNWVWPILDDQFYQGFVFFAPNTGDTNQPEWGETYAFSDLFLSIDRGSTGKMLIHHGFCLTKSWRSTAWSSG